MAVIKKTLFTKNLNNFGVLVNDTQIDSKYFKITELPDTFTGGKNAFLIAGSEYLVPDTKIQIELKDSAGNVIYHEPGEGMISSSVDGTGFITEYYEGVSKVVAVYVYPDTAYGPCTLTILGELSEYEDANGILTPVPLDWENKYNVKWQKQIDVNPSLANTTKIRFYKRPTVTISELLEPIYRIDSGQKVNSGISQSFADIRISNLETFAGDVKRVKVFRTSLGDISDFSLIQDILVESKELLTTFGLSGSVIGNTGTFTSETLKNFWNTGSLNVTLSNDRVESGIKMNGSGILTYTSSLEIKSANTYELNLDAFYSSSTTSDLEIYLSYVSQSTTFTSSVGKLTGLIPTNNLLDTSIPFKIDRDYASASLYLSQTQGEWHVGNISLRLSQDTAFSPDEISFITTMPTVIGNEDFNFKFEFYDVNNNYVPVAVTQSANFTGGNANQISKALTFDSDRHAFRFFTGSIGNPVFQTIGLNVTKTNLSGSVVYGRSVFDLTGSYISPSIYTSAPGGPYPYPGEPTNPNESGFIIHLDEFTGSLSNILVGSVTYTASCDGLFQYETIYRFEDGVNEPGIFVSSDTNQFIYKATDLSLNPTGQVITIEAKRKNLASADNILTVNSGSGKPPLTFISTNTTTGVDTYRILGTSYPYGVGETTYSISGSDQFNNEFSDIIKISPVKILDGLSVNLTNDNASLPALSNGFIESGSFILTSGSVSVKVGNESITHSDGLLISNSFDIVSAVATGVITGSLNYSTPNYFITRLDADSGSLELRIRYKDGAGDTTDITKVVTYTKNKKASPVLTFVIGNNNQSTDAKSTGEQLTTFSDSTLSVKEQYNGSTSTLTLLSTPTINSSSTFTPITKTTTNLSYPNMVNGTNSVELSVTGSVIDSEGVSRQVFGNVSLTKVKKAVPLVVVTATPQAQSVLANSSGVQTGTLSNVTINALEGTTSRFTSMTVSSVNGINVSTGTTNISGNTLVLSDRTMSAAEGSVTLTITHTDSEGSGGQTQTIVVRFTKVPTGEQGAAGTNGSNGANGADGRRTSTGMVFYQLSQGSSPATPSATSYTFSSNTFSGLTSNWGVGAPTYTAGNSNKYWYSTYTAIETTAGGGTSVPTFSAPVQAINFTGLVTFTSANNITDGTNTSNIVEPGSVTNHIGGANVTTIEGGKISTGVITSTGYSLPSGDTLASGTFTSAGTIFNLNNGSLRSKNFYIASNGDAVFKGTMQIGGTDLTAANTLNANTTATQVGLGNVQNLSAQNQAQTGLIAGTTITGGGITLSGGGNIKGGQTDFNTGTGFFLGYHGSAYKFSIGNAASKGITWDGSTLAVGGEVTIGGTLADTVKSGAASGSSALQNSDTGKSLGLTGGSVGGVTIASDKIYVGTGTHGNANTGFYVDSSGKMSLKDKLVWDGTTLSITGTVVITGGATKDAIDTAQSTADSKVLPGAVTNHIGGANVTTIDGGKISALSFYGKTARFDTGDVGGWIMDATGLYKTTGAYTLRLGANSQKISISQTAGGDSIDRVRIDASLDIDTITVSDTASLDWANSGQNIDIVYGTDSPSYVNYDTGFVLADGGSYNYGYAFGIIGLQYANEEIFVEAESFPNISNTITGQAAFPAYGETHTAYGYWNCTIRVRQFPSGTDALNQTNANAAYGTKTALLAYREFRQSYASPGSPPDDIDKEQVYGATIPAQGGGGINTPGTAIWYRVELVQNWYLEATGGNFDTVVYGNRPSSNIVVKFGRVQNGYSVFSPGGLQVYQGVRNYMNASLPSGSSGDASNFFIVKGKSEIIGSLNVTSGLSANTKQFKIQHPTNENKWLYHTSVESPRADLIYRGHLELENGSGSCLIDSSSRMSDGTFESFTKNSQLFLQNESGFDRVKGSIINGSINIISENDTSNDVISWMVVAERNDIEILKSPLYDVNGNYKTETFKSKYLEETRHERLSNFNNVI